MSAATDHMRWMARNNAFANHLLLGACEGLSEEEFAAPGVSFFPSLMLTLSHNLLVDRYYIDALTEGGEGMAVRDNGPIGSVATLKAEQTVEDLKLIAFCDSLADADLTREVKTDRGAAGFVAERIDCLLLHLFQHQIHHRGQAHAMLAGTRVKPPQLDEFYLRHDRPQDATEYGAPL